MVGSKFGIMPRREKQYSGTKGNTRIIGRVVSGEKKRRIQNSEFRRREEYRKEMTHGSAAGGRMQQIGTDKKNRR